jgi:hypothetical protein
VILKYNTESLDINILADENRPMTEKTNYEEFFGKLKNFRKPSPHIQILYPSREIVIKEFT